MSKYRPVDVRLWNDRKFLSLSDDGRLLWMFLLTAPNTLAIPGLVIGGEASNAEHLGWTVERYRERFRELFRSGLSVRAEGRVTWLPNALKYQPPANPNQVKAWSKCWDDVPECGLKHDIWQALQIACKSWSQLFVKRFQEPSRHGFANGSPNGSGNGSIQKQKQEQYQEQEQKQDQEEIAACARPAAGSPLSGLESAIQRNMGDVGLARARGKKRNPGEPTPDERTTAMRVLGKLGEYSGTRYSGAAEHLRLITAQLRDGVTEADLRKVIGYCAIEKRWKDDPKMGQYLRPETLFGPKSIAKYLDHARTWFDTLEQDEPDASDQVTPPESRIANALTFTGPEWDAPTWMSAGGDA